MGLKKAYIDGAPHNGTLELISFAKRRNSNGEPLDDSAKTDVLLASRYIHESYFFDLGPITDKEALAFIVGIVIVVLFTLLVRGGEKAWKSKASLWFGKIADIHLATKDEGE